MRVSSTVNYAAMQRLKEAAQEFDYPKYEVLLKDITNQGMQMFVYARGLKGSCITYRVTMMEFMQYFKSHLESGPFPQALTDAELIDSFHGGCVVEDFIRKKMKVDFSRYRPEVDAIKDITNFRKKLTIKSLKKLY